jgi:hypothetical protein
MIVELPLLRKQKSNDLVAAALRECFMLIRIFRHTRYSITVFLVH